MIGRAFLGVVVQILHLALLLAVAPLLTGAVRWMKARLLSRAGASPLQPWRDLLRLFRKQPVVAEGVSPLFLAAPTVHFAAIASAALLVPSFALGMASAPAADLLVVAGLLALARAALALAAVDTGTALGGLGASRAVSLGVFAEPALLLVFLSLALLAGTTNLDAVAALSREGGFGLRVSVGLAALATLAVAATEAPATGPELATIHAAMTLEYGARDLALLEAAESVKLLLWLGLVVAIFAPFGIAPAGAGPVAWVIGLGCWGLKIGLLAVALAVVGTAVAAPRLARIPEFLGLALLLGLLAAVFLFLGQGVA